MIASFDLRKKKELAHKVASPRGGEKCKSIHLAILESKFCLLDNIANTTSSLTKLTC
jgi:hypothetical protein